MSKKVEENETLEELIIQLNGLLNEIKIEQKNLKKTIDIYKLCGILYS